MIPKIFFSMQFKFQSLTSSFATDMLQLYLGLHVRSNLGTYPLMHVAGFIWIFIWILPQVKFLTGTFTVHVCVTFPDPFHLCKHVCLLLWKSWKAKYKTKYWFGLCQQKLHFTLISFPIVIPVQKRMRE